MLLSRSRSCLVRPTKQLVQIKTRSLERDPLPSGWKASDQNNATTKEKMRNVSVRGKGEVQNLVMLSLVLITMQRQDTGYGGD